MTMVFSQLAGAEVDCASEIWRHECECRWLLTNKPTRTAKHLYLYGVPDRAMLFERNGLTNELRLRDGYQKLWPKNEKGWTIKPLMGVRTLEAADRILADARKLHELAQAKT